MLAAYVVSDAVGMSLNEGVHLHIKNNHQANSMIKRNIINLFLVLTVLITITSCSSSKKIIYLQDIQPGVEMRVQEVQPIRFEKGDQIKIVVHSRDGEVAKVFNILDNSGQGNGAHSKYVVDETGYIDMPVLGRIKTAGLTREELTNEIKFRLLESRMLKDPIVTIDYENVGYSVLGEVHSPGRKLITRDNITLLEAIAQAGDLTIDGKRDNILVLRTVDGRQVPYRVNLLDTRDLYSSPVYYLQQNDVIYVEPTEKKANTSSVNGNNFLTPGFWMSTASFAISLLLLILKL